MRVPVRLVRFVSFAGANFTFIDNVKPEGNETYPLHESYHSLAESLGPSCLCKVGIDDGIIVSLDRVRRISDSRA